jgi:hypothetical protein
MNPQQLAEKAARRFLADDTVARTSASPSATSPPVRSRPT